MLLQLVMIITTAKCRIGFLPTGIMHCYHNSCIATSKSCREYCLHQLNMCRLVQFTNCYLLKLGVTNVKICCYVIGEANSREELPSLHEIRTRCIQHLDRMRPDHMRRLNPTPYKVLGTPDLDIIGATNLTI